MSTKTDPRFHDLEKKVGIFILVALVGLAAVLLTVGIENDLFTRTYTFRLTSPKGTGFSKGMPVKLSGFRIGRVKSIALNDAATVDVVLQIDRSYQKWLKKDSEARLLKEGLVGDYIIEVTGGSSPELIPEGGTIPFVKTKGLDELADEIAEKVKPVLLEVRDIISYVNDPKGDLKQSISSINRLSGSLDGTRRNVDGLLLTTRHSVEGTMAKVNAMLDSADSQVKGVKPLLDKVDHSTALLDQRLPGVLDKIDGSLGNLLAISQEVRKTSVQALPQVPAILEKTEGAIDQGNAIIEGVKGIWPIRGSIPAPDEKRLIPGDSHE